MGKKVSGLNLEGTIGMNCAEIKNLIPLMVGGDLTDEEAARLEEHVERCSPCRTLLEDYRRTHSIVRLAVETDSEAPERAPDEFVSSVFRTIRLDREGAASRRWGLWMPGIGRAAAMLMLAVGLGMFTRGLMTRSDAGAANPNELTIDGDVVNAVTHRGIPVKGRVVILARNPATGQIVPLNNWTLRRNDKTGRNELVVFGQAPAGDESRGGTLTDEDVQRGIRHVIEREGPQEFYPVNRYEPIENPGEF